MVANTTVVHTLQPPPAETASIRVHLRLPEKAFKNLNHWQSVLQETLITKAAKFCQN
jgi:hypothetical protein